MFLHEVLRQDQTGLQHNLEHLEFEHKLQVGRFFLSYNQMEEKEGKMNLVPTRD